MATLKICNKCKEKKPITDFHKCKKSKDGHKNQCKLCRFTQNKNFKEFGIYIVLETKICSTCKIKKLVKEFGIDLSKKDGHYTKCKQCANQKTRDYYTSNPEFKKEQDRKYYQNNKANIIKRTVQYGNLKYKEDLLFKLKKDISRRVNVELKKQGAAKNGKSILNFLSYSIAELKKHLETQFEYWMNWDNHGVYRISTWNDNDSSTWTWQIDHIISHSNFPYISMEDQLFKDCWKLSNLRPYSAKQNLLDGKRS